MPPKAPKVAVKDEDLEVDDEIEDEADVDELDDEESFSLDRALPDYFLVRMTTGDLHDLIHEGYVNLDAEYQRDVVWPDSKQIMLIDSMINNYYIPSVIFSVKRKIDPETGEEFEERVCMDGKQRLTSMQRFMDGIIPYKHLNGKNYYFDLPESSRTKRNRPLPLWLKKNFSNKAVSCVEYMDISESDEREIFRRVQLGVALSASEKIQGIESEWAGLVREVLKDYVHGEEGIGHYLNWLQTRGLDFSCVAQIIYCMYNYPNFAWPGIPVVDKFLRNRLPPSTDFRAQVMALFKDYLRLSKDSRYNYGFKRAADRVSPVEMVMIGLLLRHMKNCSSEYKADQINALRVQTRTAHADVRMNNRVTKSMWQFIENVKGIPKASRDTVPSATGSKKRKADRMEEDEFRPAPGRMKKQGKSLARR